MQYTGYSAEVFFLSFKGEVRDLHNKKELCLKILVWPDLYQFWICLPEQREWKREGERVY